MDIYRSVTWQSWQTQIRLTIQNAIDFGLKINGGSAIVEGVEQ